MSEIFLRALGTSDFEHTHRWHSDQDLYKTLGGPFRFVSEDAEKAWLASKSQFSNQEAYLMICLSETTEPIGIISVKEIDWITRVAQFTGLLIGEKMYQSKGYGTEALHLLLDHIFRDLGLNKLFGYALEENKASIRMLEKCGFSLEGTLKQHAFKNGAFHNLVIMSICADKYFEI